MNRDDIRIRLEQNRIPAAAELPERLEIYLKMLQEWNARMDLTASMEDSEILDRHLIDSLTVLKTEYTPPESRWIDVGTGAGFPGLVLAMARPDLDITLMDAQQKRLNFLQAVAEAADIRNARIIHARAEEGSRRRELREQFDFAAARAVAPLNTLCEYLLPYVRIGGCALCWKGPALRNEMESGRRAVHLLGGRLEMPVRCPVFGQEWDHMILPIRKTQKTPAEYPRKPGMPKARPLGEG